MKECVEMKDNQLKEDEGIETYENEEESDALINIDEKSLVRNTLDYIYMNVCIMQITFSFLAPMRFLAIVERKYSFQHNIILSGTARLGEVFLAVVSGRVGH